MGKGDEVALCRLTQLTFLRLITVEAVMKRNVLSNARALELLASMMDDPRFAFIKDEPPGVGEDWFTWAEAKTPSPGAWMDAYLAALAKGLRVRLVTFDKGFERFRRMGLELLVLT